MSHVESVAQSRSRRGPAVVFLVISSSLAAAASIEVGPVRDIRDASGAATRAMHHDAGRLLVSQPSPRSVHPVVADAGAPLAEKQGAAAPFSPCAPGMLEIDGLYCTNLMHRCIKGGRTHLNQDTDEPEPFYCDAYKEGVAQCLDREQPKHFCIDEYEYPNRPGATPMVMVSWYEAKRLCEEQGKRLCGDDEWTLACEGPERRPFPYGWFRDRKACNIDQPWTAPNDGILANPDLDKAIIQAEVERLSKSVPSGSMPRCRSPYGVMDMTGNVDEWTVNITFGGKPFQTAFKGGHWVSGARNRCRGVTVSHDEYTRYYAQGFRCCSGVATAAQ